MMGKTIASRTIRDRISDIDSKMCLELYYSRSLLVDGAEQTRDVDTGVYSVAGGLETEELEDIVGRINTI